jgi:hypothetical protein
MLARVFGGGALTAEDAAARAASIVDADLESLAESLGLLEHTSDSILQEFEEFADE